MSLSSLFGFKQPKIPAAANSDVRATFAIASLGSDKAPNRITIYPPVDPGFPVVSPEDIIHGASPKIKRLAEIAGGSASEFERLYMAPLRNLAAQVHLLPATPHSHYSAPAGLFNMALDVALLARQSAEGKIFVPEATIEVRHRTESAWRYSSFLAGLLSQLHVPVGTMTVTSQAGEQWPRYGTAVYDWLKSKNLATYYVVWNEKARTTGAEGASLLATVVPPDVMDWLASTDSQIIRDLTVAVTRDMSVSESILGAILKSVVARVKEVDALHQPSRFGRLTVGTQFEAHLLNVMRELIEDGTWRCNEPGSVVCWGSDGLYIAWPAGLDDVLAVFNKRSLQAMPHSSVALAEMLGNSGVIISKDTGVWVHDIVVNTRSGDLQTLSAMRFKDPTILIGHLPIKGLPQPFGKLLADAQREQLTLAGAGRQLPVIPASAKESGGQDAKSDAAKPVATVQSPAEPPVVTIDPEVGKKKPPTSPPPPVAARSATQAVLDHVEDTLPGDRLPPDILKRLHLKNSDSAASALGMALEQSVQYRTDRVRRLEWGVAICCTWLTEVAGFTIPDLASPLDRAGVIAKNPDGKSFSLVSKVVFSDSQEPRVALVLKLDFAARVGMPIDAKA
jgi:conjugal transfer pilus assembly protein TraI